MRELKYRVRKVRYYFRSRTAGHAVAATQTVNVSMVRTVSNRSGRTRLPNAPLRWAVTRRYLLTKKITPWLALEFRYDRNDFRSLINDPPPHHHHDYR